MGIGEADPFPMQLIQMWGGHPRVGIVAGQIPVSQVVRKDDDEVGALGNRRSHDQRAETEGREGEKEAIMGRPQRFPEDILGMR